MVKRARRITRGRRPKEKSKKRVFIGEDGFIHIEKENVPIKENPMKKRRKKPGKNFTKFLISSMLIAAMGAGYLTYTKKNYKHKLFEPVRYQQIIENEPEDITIIPEKLNEATNNRTTKPKTYISDNSVNEFYNRAMSYGDIFERAGKLHGIDPAYLIAVASVESSVGVGFSGNEPNIFQITPIAKEEIENRYRRIDINNPWDNTDGAAFLLEHYRKILLAEYTPKSEEEELRLLALSYRYGVYGVINGIRKSGGKGNVVEKVKKYLDGLYSDEPLPPTKENYDEKVIKIYEKLKLFKFHNGG